MTEIMGSSLAKTFELLIDKICEHATHLQMDGSFVENIGHLVNADSYECLAAETLLERHAYQDMSVLDYGCGAMAHRPFIESLGFEWTGVEHIHTVAHLQRDYINSLSSQIYLYDGFDLPFDSGQFGIVWAMLVLQHVTSVDACFQEIGRVLRPGGKVIAQVSSLEQVQDYMTYNFTPIGLKIAGERAGLKLTKIFPKHDVFSFLVRRVLITFGKSDDTPLNGYLGADGYFYKKMRETGEGLGLSAREINLICIMFSTHLVCEWEKI